MIYKLKKIIPEFIKDYYRNAESRNLEKIRAQLPVLSENRLADIFRNDIGISGAPVVFVHSSLERLNLGFPFYKILTILREVAGRDSTLVFPTYNKENSYDFLKSEKVFDVKKTPTFTGLLNEFARKEKKSVRSLHPTKSVCAKGPLAVELTIDHPNSHFPYDKNSPYYKAIEKKCSIIGVGVDTTYLSCVHAVDDALKDRFPVNPYHARLFKAKCVDYDRKTKIVETYAHDMSKMDFSLPVFFAEHVPVEICEDLDIEGMKFFRSDGKKMFDFMTEIAMEKQITIYKKKHYKKKNT